MTQRILILASAFPLPIQTGADSRIWNVCKGLAKKGFDVDVVCNNNEYRGVKKVDGTNFHCTRPGKWSARWIRDFVVKGELPGLSRSNTPEYLEKVKQLSEDCDVIHVEGFPPLLTAYKFSNGVIRTYGAHDVMWRNFWLQHKYFRSCNPKRLLWFRMARFAKRIEAMSKDHFDSIFCTSQVEISRFVELGIPPKLLNLMPNGVDCEYFTPSFCKNRDLPSIVFVGALSYPPNDDALRWFLSEIYPFVNKQKFFLDIIGKQPPTWLLRLSWRNPRIRILGYLPDIRTAVCKARVGIAPIRFGTGTRTKILEYMSMSKPVVATNAAVEGLQVNHLKDICIADEPRQFAEYLSRLLQDDSFSTQMGINARKNVEEHYNWDVIISNFIRALKNIVADRLTTRTSLQSDAG